MKTVWVPYKLPELKNRRGLFNVETKLADKLLAEGVIEDPNIGAHKMTAITDEEPKRVAPMKKEPKTKKVVDPEETKVTEPTQGKKIADDDLDVVAD